MTSNHLLLYRLSELMLQYEQHILSVDLLFDDEQIGDLVKSIQIDSPYQQMLLEGVITESVREEKLYVSFTVEGYFHYVLGEVIYNKTQGKGSEELKQIVEENKLNGAKEGVEQCLIRDVQKDDLTRLIWLIDQNEVFIKICVNPVFTGFKFRYQLLTASNKQKVNSSIKKILSNLLNQPTEMDYKLIFEVISLANNQNLKSLANQMTSSLVKLVKIDSATKAVLISKTLEFLQDYPLRKKVVNDLINWQKTTKSQGMLSLEIFSAIAKTYEVMNFVNEAENYYKKCLKLEMELFGEYHLFTSTSYNQIGLLKLKKGQYYSGLNYFKKNLNIKKQILHESSSEITTAQHNIALAYQYIANYKQCILQNELVLERRFKIEGKISLNTSLTISNLGIAYIQSEFDAAKGEQLLVESVKINSKILGDPNIRNISTYRWLALVEWKKQDCDLVKVKQMLKRALDDNIQLFGKNNLETAYCYDDLFRFYMMSNQKSKAKAIGEKALLIYKDVLGDKHNLSLKMTKYLKTI